MTHGTNPRKKQPEDLTPREAKDLYLDRRRTDCTEETLNTFHYRLKQFVEWCENQGIESVTEFSGWLFESYQTDRRSDGLSAASIEGQMWTVKGFVEYLESIEAVEQGLAEKIDIPDIDAEDRSRDKRLDPDRAKRLLRYYRNTPAVYGSRQHVIFELFWHTGARLGAVRALDRRDFYPDEGYVEFHHRPDQGTPLKNKTRGERPVAIRDEVVAAVRAYLRGDRWDTRDEYGREPLITTREGRVSKNSLRAWTYHATVPCNYKECPHGHDPDTCDYLNHTHASKCPSSLAPHHVRTGSITWQLNQGMPPEVVSERVNATIDVIEKHYDKEEAVREMEKRRRPHLDKLSME